MAYRNEPEAEGSQPASARSQAENTRQQFSSITAKQDRPEKEESALPKKQSGADAIPHVIYWLLKCIPRQVQSVTHCVGYGSSLSLKLLADRFALLTLPTLLCANMSEQQAIAVVLLSLLVCADKTELTARVLHC